MAAAQEIGHVFDRLHAPCGNPAGRDPNYPKYGMFLAGSIGEFGFDTVTNQVFDPTSTSDFMSYCGGWVSPYTYLGLMNAFISLPNATSPLRPEHQFARGEYLRLNFRVHADGSVEVLSSFHLDGIAPDGESGPLADIWCDLLGPDDRILETHRCHASDSHSDADEPELLFRELIPWHPDTRVIVFRRNGEVCHRYELPAAPPDITVHAREPLADRDGIMSLEWQPAQKAAQKASSLTYVLRYSHDGGATWRAIAADLTEPRHDVNLNLLPGGDDCRFQVVASSGILQQSRNPSRLWCR